eukprot:COSAG02_NODE_9291_length_2264_cov_19.465127_2_plen_93_part_00
MVSCDGSDTIVLQFFSDDTCDNEMTIADVMKASVPDQASASVTVTSDWDSSLTAGDDWKTMASMSMGGQDVQIQTKVTKIDGCPSIGTGARS